MCDTSDIAVSVVVPVYNVEPFLRQCLDSILAQTLRDIEIICMNDGSTDGSLAILEKYAGNDPRVRVFSHENHGYGYTVNRGLDLAQGRYVGIVESDDWIEPTMYADLVRQADQTGADMAKADFYRDWTKSPARREVFHFFRPDEDGRVITPRNYRSGAVLQKKPSVWSAVYRRHFLEEHRIHFMETAGAAFQDTSFSFKTLALAETMVCVERPLVHYRQDNEKSSIHSMTTVDAVFDEYAEIERFIASRPEFKNTVARLLAPMLFNTCVWNYNRLEPELKMSFLKNASVWFSRLIAQGKVDWSAFGSQVARTNFRMIAYDPATYHQWRQGESLLRVPTTTTRRALTRLKRELRRIIPPSRAGFRKTMEAVSRQIEVQQRYLEQLAEPANGVGQDGFGDNVEPTRVR